MKSFLKDRDTVFSDLYNEIFALYPKEHIIEAAAKLIREVKNTDEFAYDYIGKALDNILGKTETYNVLLTLFELEKKLERDEELKASMAHPSYNQHRTIAINICDMYGSGATSFFGYVDCTFRSFFPNNHPKSFLAKGICALTASTAEVIVVGMTSDYTDKNIELLLSRGVPAGVLIEMVYDMQRKYNPSLTLNDCVEHVYGVLRKEQTYHTIQLCVAIDKGVENKEFGEQFLAIVGNDEGLYGVDETVNFSIAKLYGMIALTNFGYLDKEKPGIIGELDNDHHNGNCNTYMDDNVCALVAAACARLAHNNPYTNSKPLI